MHIIYISLEHHYSNVTEETSKSYQETGSPA